MKSKMKRYLIPVIAIFSMFGITACASNNINSPEDAIINAYGDRQFRISFDSTNLENPIADIYYTAKNMPVLPTPSKVGYVFDGWFFDENYIDQCNIDEGDLLWKMKDLTLYAKWDVEEIVNNGQYDIEYEAHIDEDSIAYGPKAEKDRFYRFDEDIVKYGTYIEKNDNGTFLRIQYDCRTRGPVLGGEDADSDNFAPQTYTVTDPKNRINKELSIFDRTSTLQTIYYDISGLELNQTILLYVKYYNWIDNIPEKERAGATVFYTVEFNITRFIGFGAPFINANARLEDGVYTLPTHYGKLNKTISMLDMFNPVTSYIKADKGHYSLYKPMSAYNNDFGEIKEEHYPLRTTGFAKELTAFLIDQKKVVEEGSLQGDKEVPFIPQECKAEKYINVRVEFNHKNGQYFYIFDLGTSLDKDIVLFGGSSGAMEGMFSFPYSYRRLMIDYKSMVRLADWPYAEPTGDRYVFKKTFTLYPGYNLDFQNSNTDFEQYQNYLSSVNYPNCFYTLDENGTPKVYTSRVNISPVNTGHNYLQYSRYNYQLFEMSFEIFDYDPLKDGTLYSRDSQFTTAGTLGFSNSTSSENIVGKSVNVGEAISLYELYREKVASHNATFEYTAYEVDNSLHVNFDKKVELKDNFKFKDNVAILYDIDNKTHQSYSLVILAKKENPKVTMIDDGWTLNEGNMFTTEKRFNIGDNVTLPNIQYIYYNNKKYTRDLKKDDAEDAKNYTDFINISFWELSQGVYTTFSPLCGQSEDFTMNSEKVVCMMQFANQFGEFTNYYCMFKGVSAGEYKVTDDSNNVITNGDLKYDGGRRFPVTYENKQTIDIIDETSLNKAPKKLELEVNDEGKITKTPIEFSFALVFLKKEKVKAYNLNDIYDLVKNEDYAVVYLYYQNDFGDQILYKAQYNFKVEGGGVSDVNIINENVAYFANQTVLIESPLLTNNEYKNLKYGYLDITKKVGKNYIDDVYDSVHYYDKGYQWEVEFRESGTYLLTFSFDLVYNFNGDLLFDYHDGSDTYSRINFSVSKEVKVYERAVDILVTFATDNAHPFDMTSDELFGYELKIQGDMQYASKTFKAGEKVKALTSDAFKKTTSKLYKWADKANHKMALPGDYMVGIHIKLSTLKPVVFAKWDNGCTVRVFIDKYGQITESDSLRLSRSTTTGSDYYELDTARIHNFKLERGYQIYGWRCDQNVFYQNIQVGGATHMIRTDLHIGQLKGFLELSGDTSFTAILKKPTSVTYEAYDNKGNKVEFLNRISSDYKAFVGDSLVDTVSRTKFKELTNAQCSDLELKLQYWTVYDSISETYVKCDLNTLILKDQYSVNRIIKLRAIFA